MAATQRIGSRQHRRVGLLMGIPLTALAATALFVIGVAMGSSDVPERTPVYPGFVPDAQATDGVFPVPAAAPETRAREAPGAARWNEVFPPEAAYPIPVTAADVPVALDPQPVTDYELLNLDAALAAEQPENLATGVDDPELEAMIDRHESWAEANLGFAR